MTETECGCARCRVVGAGLPAGPYTPAQFALISPPEVATSSAADAIRADAAFAAAEAARDAARAAYDAVAAEWERAVAEHRSALLRAADPYERRADGSAAGPRRAVPGRLAELARVEAELRERRDDAWRSVVRGNEALRLAYARAVTAVADAARLPGWGG